MRLLAPLMAKKMMEKASQNFENQFNNPYYKKRPETKEGETTTEIKEIKQGNEVWVFAQQRDGKVPKVVYELLGKENQSLSLNKGVYFLHVTSGDYKEVYVLVL